MLAEGIIFDGRYLLTKPLGSGGYAEVWLAQDTLHEDLHVAMKIYGYGEDLQPEDIRYLRRQFRITYNLNHTNLLVPRYDGVYNGMPYLVMPFCPNGSAERLIGEISEDEAWHFIEDVALGLSELHRNKLIHNDVKPSNIMISAEGHYLITDFEISAERRASLFNAVDFQGTRAYSAPERFNGETSYASDVWALGASVYELLSGELPYGEAGGKEQVASCRSIKGVGRKMNKLLAQSMKLEPGSRLTAIQIVEVCKRRQTKGMTMLTGIAATIAVLFAFASSTFFGFNDTYTIESIGGGGGRIAPEGKVEVTKGATFTLYAVPDCGNRLDYMIVDGDTVRSVQRSGSYTIENVKSRHYLKAEFRAVDMNLFNRHRSRAISHRDFGRSMNNPYYLQLAVNECNKALEIIPDSEEIIKLKQECEK
jgi:serine/threonine protein kinase